MNKDLKKILKTLGVEDGDYYINDDGRVKKKGILFDEDTGIYQTESGEFKKEGILFDESTGLKQNERGEFKEEGILFDKDTGIYQDKDGNYRKKGILFDEKTGYYKDKDGNIKKEGFFGGSNHINTNDSKGKRKSLKLPNSKAGLIGYFIGFAIVISIALTFLTIAFFFSPIIFLIWFLVKKREPQWTAILGMIFSAYLIYDITSGGFITNSMMKMQRTGEEKYIALGYFVIFATTLGFFIDKYTSSKIPIAENGNFFEQKNIKERRPFIAGFSVLLLVIFSIFQFVNFSGSKNYNNSNYNQNNSTITNSGSNNINNNVSASNGKTAIITDPDGFTNVRAGKGTNTNVIYELKTNENFTVYPTNEKWWKVKLSNGQTGFIFHNRVHLLNNNLKGKYPIASNRVLNHNDLNRISKSELQVMRNEIFARYGYIFKSGGKMDKYFRNTNWYRPQFNNVDSKLTQIEKKNIELIQKYEK